MKRKRRIIFKVEEFDHSTDEWNILLVTQNGYLAEDYVNDIAKDPSRKVKMKAVVVE